MNRLIISADIHGSLSSWIFLESLVGKTDGLAIAGDLFDTIYGNYSDPDYSPESIKKALAKFSRPFFYVWGNCDNANFYPGAAHSLEFRFNNLPVFMHHGHRHDIEVPAHARLVIQGHSHHAVLEKKERTVFFNPGSITVPRSGIATYGVLEENEIHLVAVATGDIIMSRTVTK